MHIIGEMKGQYTERASTYGDDKVKLFERARIDYQELMDFLMECCDLELSMNLLDVGAGTEPTSMSISEVPSGSCTVLGMEPVDVEIESLYFYRPQDQTWAPPVLSVLLSKSSFHLIIFRFCFQQKGCHEDHGTTYGQNTTSEQDKSQTST